MLKQALIVDDSRSACRFLAKLLAEHGVGSESVNSAEDALDYLRTKKPDVIFLDHNMPGMDGLETVKIIKSNPETATIPVLMYTTQEGEVYLGQARALGAVDVLLKESVHERLEESLAKLGMGNGPDREALERRRHASAETPDWESLLTRMQSELSRQMYLILAEEQIAQKSQMRWLASNIKGHLDSTSDEMVRRLEAKQDLQWEEQRARGSGNLRLVATLLVLLVLVVCGGVWWQLQSLADLERHYTAGAQAGQRQIEELRGQLAALTSNPTVATATEPVIAPARMPIPAPAPSTTQDSAVLQGEGGVTVGRLLGMAPANGGYEGLSASGYLFRVGARGEIGFELRRRYFASPNCIGDPLVDVQPGLVFRDANRQLWFTDLEGQTIELPPLSMMDEDGACLPVEEEVTTLRALLANEAALTGLSAEYEPVKLARP